MVSKYTDKAFYLRIYTFYLAVSLRMRSRRKIPLDAKYAIKYCLNLTHELRTPVRDNIYREAIISYKALKERAYNYFYSDPLKRY